MLLNWQLNRDEIFCYNKYCFLLIVTDELQRDEGYHFDGNDFN